MRGDVHVRFGGRAEETGRGQPRYRASVRPLLHDTDEQVDAGAEIGPIVEAGPDLDELCRLAAREMIAVALEAERRAWLDAHAD